MVVWIAMMEKDTYEAARNAASKFNDKRVRQFYDSQKAAGKTFAGSLGHKGRIAWDFYLFYTVGSEWLHLPPEPGVFLHQLRESWADRNRRFEKDKLAGKLTETMQSLFP